VDFRDDRPNPKPHRPALGTGFTPGLELRLLPRNSLLGAKLSTLDGSVLCIEDCVQFAWYSYQEVSLIPMLRLRLHGVVTPFEILCHRSSRREAWQQIARRPTSTSDMHLQLLF
jgi:hypothetical protein